jgi:hypothetical protein
MEPEIQKVIDVWTIEGKCPEYHKAQKKILKKNWPTLYNAIIELIRESS